MPSGGSHSTQTRLETPFVGVAGTAGRAQTKGDLIGGTPLPHDFDSPPSPVDPRRMNTAARTLGSVADVAVPHHRRSREEVEALAKNFVAAPAEDALAISVPRVVVGVGIAGAVLVAALAWFAWPEPEAARPAVTVAPRATPEADQWRQKFEAERERKRRELAAGKEYLERIAAADSALMKDMTTRASQLAERTMAIPAASVAEGVPTPRDVPARVAAAPAQPKAAAASQPEPAKPAPAAMAAPQEVAQAPRSSCAIHVSELSSSGKLTYQDVTRMKGARVDAGTGIVLTPPVPARGGRTVAFEVAPDGCVRVRK